MNKSYTLILFCFEIDKFTALQKRLQDSESQRLNLISQSNKESFALNTKFAKLRTDFEKSEASRQTLEYELSLAKTNYNKEKLISSEKEKMLEEISKNYQGKCFSVSMGRFLF